MYMHVCMCIYLSDILNECAVVSSVIFSSDFYNINNDRCDDGLMMGAADFVFNFVVPVSNTRTYFILIRHGLFQQLIDLII